MRIDVYASDVPGVNSIHWAPGYPRYNPAGVWLSVFNDSYDDFIRIGECSLKHISQQILLLLKQQGGQMIGIS